MAVVMATPVQSGCRRIVLDAVARAPYGLRQPLMAAAYSLMPRRIGGLLPMLARSFLDLSKGNRPLLPDPHTALTNPDGFCGLTGPISVAQLIEGYRRGMFVMHHIGPLKWWAPQHRMVLFFDRCRVEKTVRRLLRNQRFQVTFDQSFTEVLKACASPRDGGTPLTWITPRITGLFEQAHRDGYCHSVEVRQDGKLVGGLFGFAIGRVFFTESQFHTARDASKVGFAVLNRHLQHWGYVLNDGKHPTRYLVDSGMIPITREQFSELTVTHCAGARPEHDWRLETELLDDRWEPAQSKGVRMDEVLPAGSCCPWTVEELLTTKRSPTW